MLSAFPCIHSYSGFFNWSRNFCDWNDAEMFQKLEEEDGRGWAEGDKDRQADIQQTMSSLLSSGGNPNISHGFVLTVKGMSLKPSATCCCFLTLVSVNIWKVHCLRSSAKGSVGECNLSNFLPMVLLPSSLNNCSKFINLLFLLALVEKHTDSYMLWTIPKKHLTTFWKARLG